MKRSLPLWGRLALAFGLLCALLVVVTATGIVQMKTVQALSDRQAVLAGLRQDVDRWSAMTRLNVARTLTLAKAGNPAALAQWLDAEMKKTSAEISVVQKKLDAALTGAQERALLEKIAAARKTYVDLRGELLKRHDAGLVAEVDSKLLPAAEGYLAALDAVVKLMDAESAEQDKASDAAVASGLMMLAGVCGLALLLGAVMAWAVARNIVSRVRDAEVTARRIADGDLTQPVQVAGGDEIGQLQQALSAMQDALRRTVAGIRSGTDSVASATSQIATGNHDLSSRTEHAASSLQQTAATMSQLSEAIHQSAGSAGKAHGLAEAAALVARRGGEVVGEVVRTMNEINAGSARIADITGVIDSIAFQTNILALNAAVEAARAGDQGRGFAVVAAEVRTLASRCADAAREIRELIDASTHKVRAGTQLVQSAGSTMQEIERSVGDVSQAIGTVTNAASGQANGIGEVNRAVAALDGITQQNAALVEEAAAAAASLKDQASALTRMVSRFQLGAVPA